MIANVISMAVLGGLVGFFVALAADCFNDRVGDRATNILLGVLFSSLAVACLVGAAMAAADYWEAFIRSVR